MNRPRLGGQQGLLACFGTDAELRNLIRSHNRVSAAFVCLVAKGFRINVFEPDPDPVAFHSLDSLLRSLENQNSNIGE